jgi:leucyl-tRNA synthetase
MRNYLYIFLFLLTKEKAFSSQELNCQVSVVSVQVQGTTEKQIFDQLQKSIFEFMNNTRWTKDNFTVNERIDCSVSN